LYGLKAPSSEGDKVGSEGEEDDIETAIRKEIAEMKESSRARKDMSKDIFVPVKTGVDCVFFMKTRKPVDPVKLIHAIVEDAAACTNLRNRRSKHLNRLIPVLSLGKATENNITKLARQALAPWFDLVPGAGDANENAEEGTEEGTEEANEDKTEKPPYSVSPLAHLEIPNMLLIASLVRNQACDSLQQQAEVRRSHPPDSHASQPPAQSQSDESRQSRLP
jgi:tRNA acetyltransferase TAN1